MTYCIFHKMPKLPTGCVNAQYMRKICARLYFSPMRNICARFVHHCTYFFNTQYTQDCTYFSNVQYMHKIFPRLYVFLQCAIYVQDLHKIVVISSMRNICARFAQDCT